MAPSTPFDDAAKAPELRVLEGRLKGAQCALQRHRPTRVGAGPGHDIVLPALDIGPCRLSLELRGEGLWVQVLAGEVGIGDRHLPAGAEQVVVLHTPLQLGRAVVAVAGAVASQGPDARRPDEGRPPAARARWLQRGLVPAGSVLCALSLGGLALGSSPPAEGLDPRQAARQLEAALHEAGLEELRVQPAQGPALRVTGYLDTSAQRAVAARLLGRQALPGQLDVWVNGVLVAAVQEIFRAHHVAAQAVPMGPGRVAVHTQRADDERLEGIVARARQDVPGLLSIELHNTPPAVPAAPSPVAETPDPGKRIASIVPGESAYVVTADGTRYFQGAVLPSGERIAEIRPGDVRLVREAEGTANRRF